MVNRDCYLSIFLLKYGYPEIYIYIAIFLDKCSMGFMDD